jgi:hypothetical protein
MGNGRHTNFVTHLQSSPQGPTLKEYVHNQISVVAHAMYSNHEHCILASVKQSPLSSHHKIHKHY